ncbi:hypothetical protein THRCLA_02521 [Thraustotheca clavata]|uniref:Uncharacterized protein n=1 Tax=Thraustotheca clavata TaxID=74557 RepID=A0A1W0A4W3_9STRA|nr:hypothetical protein THRCLA_02521 [Thraustotheca clavata]
MEAAWRNAECVTSLYERLQELELRDAQLEAEVLKLREESQSMYSGDVTASIDLARAIRERDEWQDLSKQQEEEIHRLEVKLKTITMEHSEQISKWKERCVFDPNQPKRVALCMASLQKTLDARIEENEVMTKRMQDMYAQNSVLFQENCALREQESTRIDQLKRCRSYTLYMLIKKKSMHQVNWSWRRWLTHVSQIRFDEESKSRAETLVSLSSQQIQIIQEHHLQNFQRRWHQLRKLNTLLALKQYLASIKQSRANADAKTRRHLHALMHSHFQHWHQLSYRTKRLKLLFQHYYKRCVQTSFFHWERQVHYALRVAHDQELLLQQQYLKSTKVSLHETQLALEQSNEQVNVLQAHLNKLHSDSEKSNCHFNQEFKKIYNHVAHQHNRRKQRVAKQRMLNLWRGLCHFKHKIEMVHKLHCLKSLRRTILHWHNKTRAKLCIEKNIHHMTRRKMLQWARITFDTWLVWVTKRHHRKQRVELLQSRREVQFYIKPALQNWKVYTSNQLKRLYVLDQVVARRATDILRQSLTLWSQLTTYLIDREARLQCTLSSIFIQADKITLHNIFWAWVRTTNQSFSIKKWINKYNQRQAYRQLQRVWRAWVTECHTCLVKRRTLLKLFTTLGKSKPKCRALTQWKLFMVLHQIFTLHQKTLSDLNSEIASLNTLIHQEQKKIEDKNLSLDRLSLAQTDAMADVAQWQTISHKLETRMTKVECCLMSWEEHSLKQNYIITNMNEAKSMQTEDHLGEVASLHDQLKTLKHQHLLLTTAQTNHAESLEAMKLQLSSVLAKKALQIWLQRSQVYTFNQWKRYVKQQKHSRYKMTQVIILFQTNTARKIFLAWKYMHALHKKRDLLFTQWQARRAQTLLNCTFQAWVTSCRKAKHLKAFLQKFGMTFRHAELYEKFHTWTAFANARKSMRKCLAGAINHLSNQILQFGWNVWRTAAAELAIGHTKASLIKAENTLQKIWFRIIQRNVLNFWRQSAAISRHERHLLMRCASRLRYFSVGKSFETWRYHSHLLKHHRIGTTLLFQVLQRQMLKSHWKKWRQVHYEGMRESLASSQSQIQQYQEALDTTKSVVESISLQLRTTQEHTQVLKQQLRASICVATVASALRYAFTAWKKVINSKKDLKIKVLKVQRHMTRQIKRSIWKQWLLYMKIKVDKSSRNAAIALHFKLAFLQLYFRLWMRYSKQNKSFKEVSRKVCYKLSRVVLRLSWNRWAAHNAFQRIACYQIVKWTAVWELNVLQQYWSRWHVELQTKKTLAATDKAKMERVMLFLTDRKRNARLYYFTLWRRYVPIRRRKYELEVLADKFILQRSWNKWQTSLQRRHCWKCLAFSFRRRLLYSALVQWRSTAISIRIEDIEKNYESRLTKLQNQYTLEKEDLEAHLISSHSEIMRLKQGHAAENEIYATGLEELRSCAHKALFRLNKVLSRIATLHKLKQILNAWVRACRLEKDEISIKLMEFRKNSVALVAEKAFTAWKSFVRVYRRKQRLLYKFQLRYLKYAVNYWYKRTRCRALLRQLWIMLEHRAKRILSQAIHHWVLSALQMHMATNYTRELDRERRLSIDASNMAVENTSRETQIWKKRLALKTIIYQLSRLALQYQAQSFQIWKNIWQSDLWKYQTQIVSQGLRESLESSFEGKINKIAAISRQESVLAREALIFPLESMFHVLFRAKTIDQLFQGITSELHTPGKLWLCDPKKNELWSMVNSGIHVVATHIGIAGHVFHSGANYRSTDVSRDRLFHPMVDKYVLEPLLAQSSKSSSCLESLHMVCVAIKSKGGSMLGIVQMACASPELTTDMYILCYACAFAVGSIFHDVLQNSRDQSQAKVIKSFHQQKAWKQYYVEISNRLKAAQAERTALESAKSNLEASYVALQARHDQLRREAHLNEQTQHEFLQSKQAQLQVKISALENKLIERENVMGDLEHAVAEKSHKLRKYKLALRTIHSQSRDKVQESNSMQQLAEITNLRNQLTRFQSDARFLSKAIQHILDHGSLPKGMESEVLRICQVVN